MRRTLVAIALAAGVALALVPALTPVKAPARHAPIPLSQVKIVGTVPAGMGFTSYGSSRCGTAIIAAWYDTDVAPFKGIDQRTGAPFDFEARYPDACAQPARRRVAVSVALLALVMVGFALAVPLARRGGAAAGGVAEGVG